jgi:hypothetical protein
MVVTEPADAGHVNLGVRDNRVGFVQAEMLEVALPEVFDHTGVPHQVSLIDRSWGKRFEKVWLEGLIKIVDVAEPLHEVPFLRCTELGRRSSCLGLCNIPPDNLFTI